MRSLVPFGHFRNISGHLFTWLVCGSFQWLHGLLFIDCIVWDDKDEVIGFKRSHWIHLGSWSNGSPKLQLFQKSQHSHVTNCRLIFFSAYFPWNMTLKYKMQLSEGSWDKIPCSKSSTQCFPKEDIFSFLAVYLSKLYTKVPEVVFASSLQRLPGKLTSLLEPLHRPTAVSTQTTQHWSCLKSRSRTTSYKRDGAHTDFFKHIDTIRHWSQCRGGSTRRP